MLFTEIHFNEAHVLTLYYFMLLKQSYLINTTVFIAYKAASLHTVLKFNFTEHTFIQNVSCTVNYAKMRYIQNLTLSINEFDNHLI